MAEKALYKAIQIWLPREEIEALEQLAKSKGFTRHRLCQDTLRELIKNVGKMVEGRPEKPDERSIQGDEPERKSL